MVTFEDHAVLGDSMNSQLDIPMQYKADVFGRSVYRCKNDFGPLRKIRNIPKFIDFGLCTRLNSGAPEVILGCGWNTSADVWDIIQGKELFSRIYNTQGHYDAKAHLAEMIALLGPLPLELISRSNSSDRKWPKPIKREDSQICETPEQYFGGPFFDENGI
ncbi:kinase domain containing protein [Paecilomyces variotii No. 5]|uniref:Kinase domain containing protein n=1 Tax=Byssochlamys spectabilis (strain No. 5 / NBRC 109023) TaxID=1356009 RepID=V5FND8_BYSSN|nr:kinase domain containing protein [Paecilomyces variotii No. 5]